MSLKRIAAYDPRLARMSIFEKAAFLGEGEPHTFDNVPLAELIRRWLGRVDMLIPSIPPSFFLSDIQRQGIPCAVLAFV